MIHKEDLGDYKIKYFYLENGIEEGYIVIEDAIDIINIIDVYVNENKRREGIASKLLKEIMIDYNGRNVKFMLEVSTNNNPAFLLYKKFGFNVISVRKKYYKNSDALIMEKVSGK